MSRTLCPRCRKQDLKYLPWLGQLWECRTCGWRGPLVVEENNERI